MKVPNIKNIANQERKGRVAHFKRLVMMFQTKPTRGIANTVFAGRSCSRLLNKSSPASTIDRNLIDEISLYYMDIFPRKKTCPMATSLFSGG